MLALYDSEGNKLRDSKALDRTALYESLLRRFVLRERNKDFAFQGLLENDRERELDIDMQRLGVAALGMYNRRQLHILSPDLTDDVQFFDLGRGPVVSSGRALTQADLLLGSFFFVHKSRALHTAGATDLHEEAAAFEFLHNTFGEFLTADFIIRQAVAEVEGLRALEANEVLRPSLEKKLGDADGFSRAWFASLVYTPLFTRPVVLEMIREWIDHVLRRKQLPKAAFLLQLDRIVINQVTRLLTKREMPSIMRKEAAQEGYRAPFGDHPLPGHIAIYSINLVLLRTIVDDEPFIFDESLIPAHEDGTRPWDQLTRIWLSWFALEHLNGVSAVLRADRQGATIVVSRGTAAVPDVKDRLATVFNVGVALADNITSGIVGFVLYNSARKNKISLEEVTARLASEAIDIELDVKVKLLLSMERVDGTIDVGTVLDIASHALSLAVRTAGYTELTQIVASLRRIVERTVQRSWLFSRSTTVLTRIALAFGSECWILG